jgi:thiol-disulfide isomerase/thioredoxin
VQRLFPLLFLLLFSALSEAAKPIKLKLQPGATAPTSLGVGADGSKLDLRSFRGTIVIVNFWATWCPPCIKELTTMDGVQRQVDPKVLKIISVNIEDRQVFSKAVKLLAKTNLTLAHDRRGSVARAFGVGPIPHMVMIDPEGKVIRTHIGYGEGSLEPLVAELNALIAQYRPKAGAAPESTQPAVLPRQNN